MCQTCGTCKRKTRHSNVQHQVIWTSAHRERREGDKSSILTLHKNQIYPKSLLYLRQCSVPRCQKEAEILHPGSFCANDWEAEQHRIASCLAAIAINYPERIISSIFSQAKPERSSKFAVEVVEVIIAHRTSAAERVSQWKDCHWILQVLNLEFAPAGESQGLWLPG